MTLEPTKEEVVVISEENKENVAVEQPKVEEKKEEVKEEAKEEVKEEAKEEPKGYYLRIN